MNSMQKAVDKFCELHSLKTTPEHRLIDLVSEVGEVAKEILKMSDYGKKPVKKSREIEEELGDAAFSLAALANNFDVDLETALKKAMEKYSTRLKKGSAGSEVDGPQI